MVLLSLSRNRITYIYLCNYSFWLCICHRPWLHLLHIKNLYLWSFFLVFCWICIIDTSSWSFLCGDPSAVYFCISESFLFPIGCYECLCLYTYSCYFIVKLFLYIYYTGTPWFMQHLCSKRKLQRVKVHKLNHRGQFFPSALTFLSSHTHSNMFPILHISAYWQASSLH
jgi:hypothetical protein